MIKVDNVRVYNFDGAIRGMRNPLNSWDKSDSYFSDDTSNDVMSPLYIVGPNDMKLMQKLHKAGTEHRKFLRQIFVSMDISAPIFWWSEMDTYKINTTRNSCSFMHKGVSEEFTIDDFTTYLPDDDRIEVTQNELSVEKSWHDVITSLNILRKQYLDTKDPNTFEAIRSLLPSGYMQKSTITLNYEVIYDIIYQRKNHRLQEWRDFCDMLNQLPYVKEISENDVDVVVKI